jgi:glycogen operon protein
MWAGNPYPLGMTWDGSGVNFALFSENVPDAELCLFDRPEGTRETARIPTKEQTNQVWHGYLLDARPGQLYGYRVHGPHKPVSPCASINFITAHDGFTLINLISYNQ